MANADGMNILTSAGFGAALTITGAAADFTFNQTVLGSVASSIALTTATGTSDTVNLGYSATDGFTNTAAITIAGVEILNITTNDTNAVAPTAAFGAPITATSATTVTVSGDAGFNATGLTATTLTSFDASGVTATGTGGAVTLTTGALAAAATLTGGAGTNTIDAGAALKAVTLTGGAGLDALSGGAGADTINGGNGGTTGVGLVGGAGNDIITGGTGTDTIAGGTGTDTINAGTGNDIITGGVGADVIDGEAGTDTYVTDSTQIAADIEGAGTGTSTGVVINLGATAVTNSTVLSVASTNLAQGLASVAAGSAAYAYGSSLVTNSTAVTTISNVENVTLSGNGANYVVGSATANIITIGTGDDVIDGGAGNDIIIATLIANADADDTFLGGTGTDALHITNSTDGGAAVVDDQVGIESIVMLDSLAAADSTLTLTYTSANTKALTIDASALDAGEDFTFVGSDAEVDGAITITGGGGANIITTGAGADIITGGYGIDTIVAGAGADTITTGFGADIITGGTGSDIITPGLGIDVVIIGASDGTDTITFTEGTSAVDTIQTSAVTSANYFNVIGFAVAADLLNFDGTLNTTSGSATLAGGEGGDETDIASIGNAEISSSITVAMTDDIIDGYIAGTSTLAALKAAALASMTDGSGITSTTATDIAGLDTALDDASIVLVTVFDNEDTSIWVVSNRAGGTGGANVLAADEIELVGIIQGDLLTGAEFATIAI
jgi:Ca2+-binding RTX toxin-like protein